MSNEELDYEWFDAVADDEDEANDMMQKTNLIRFRNAMRVKRAAGG